MDSVLYSPIRRAGVAWLTVVLLPKWRCGLGTVWYLCSLCGRILLYGVGVAFSLCGCLGVIVINWF